MRHVWGTEETYTGLWLGDLKEIDHFEYLDVDGKII
jgi:hypothetical protein